MTTYAKLGSVSHGTMRPEDLIPAFVACLDDLHKAMSLDVRPGEEMDCVQAVSAKDDWLGALERRMEADGYYESKEADWDLEELFEHLNTFAPPYCYFGSHPGDGADYGFWPSLEALEDDVRYGEVLGVSDTSEVPEEYAGLVWHVNDHGNGTLYQWANGEGEELWSCV